MKIKFLLLITLMFSCSLSPENKAKNNIQDYMKKNLNDPSSYQPVDYSTSLQDTTTYADDPQFKILIDSENFWKNKEDSVSKKLKDEAISKPNFYLDTITDNLISAYNDSVIIFIGKIAANSVHYKGRPCGFKIIHTYRAKNGFGALTIGEMIFHFDSSYNLIYAEQPKNE